MPRSAIMNIMTQAAFKAARSLTRDFGEVENLQVSRKGPADFVSAADKKAEDIIYHELSKARPNYSFLMEESGFHEGTDKQHRWIIDPLDGTTNFLHSIPHFAISIALESQGKLVAGLVYNPITNELFTAERGIGAFMNDRRIRVAARRDLIDCVIGNGNPHIGRGDHDLFLRQLTRVMREVSGIRRFGSASLDLAWIAAGRLDGFWEWGLSPWDIAAGTIIIREAGGFITDENSKNDIFEKDSIIAGNEFVHQNLQALLKEAKTI